MRIQSYKGINYIFLYLPEYTLRFQTDFRFMQPNAKILVVTFLLLHVLS